MGVLLQLLASLGACLAAYGISKGLRLIYDELTSPLRQLPGPKSSSFIYGNFKEIRAEGDSTAQERWVQEYGSTFKFRGFFGTTRLYTTDLKALNHIIVHTDIYQKPEATRYNISRIVGSGVLVVEGDKHKQQRKVMNPAFGPSQIRELTDIFIAKSLQLRDIWAADNAEHGGTSRVEILSWLSRTTLDIIGLAGFNYSFDALNENHEMNELNAAFATLFHAGTRRARDDGPVKIAQQTMSRIGNQLLRESKASIRDKSEWKTRDLLSLLVRSNMDTDLPPHQRMSDQDVLDQVPTFLVAGHETTSTGTTWALFALAQEKAIQDRLREELLAVDTDTPTMDELNALPYLDMVVRETMRLHAPVPTSMREAVRDDIIPLSKPFTDRKGVVHDTIKVRKGQALHIPIVVVNREKSIWGEDAMEFNPERWKSIPQAAGTIPGVWGNMLTFLGGPRACIGYRFSLVEMKALLFTLLRAFEFELAVPAKDIIKKSTIVQRPVLATDPDAGNQMPMLIRPVTRS
ncbi:putative cytochrome p450 [Lyophyllum shimeji]|uniref:Cytochrome p450 n=1 Tax=Lyophyllum shimeji TaxID=47721 RepID=A0A9P3PHN6_LYOSH|nr:putative cytochrome p450 [Lyophyllum shimeji]